MSQHPLTSTAIHPHLELIDAELADAQVELWRRPFLATIRFMQDFVMAVETGGESQAVPASTSELLTAPWGAHVHVEVYKWYKSRYGTALRSEGNALGGVVLLYGTPFALQVPSTISRPEEPGQTAWLTFPHDVQTDEDPISWITNRPDLSALPSQELKAVKDIAGLLRAINVKCLGISHSDPIATGFLRGIPVHLRSAAELALTQWREGAVDRAYWELQMACECAFKTLQQLKNGTFLHTHDLFLLHDEVAKFGFTFSRDLLKKLPRWDDAMNLRYGQVPSPKLPVYYEAYRTTLLVVASVLAPAVTLNLAGASLKLRAHPWDQAVWANDTAGAD